MNHSALAVKEIKEVNARLVSMPVGENRWEHNSTEVGWESGQGGETEKQKGPRVSQGAG